MIRRRCKRGHVIAGANLSWATARGKRYRRCRRCYNTYMRAYVAAHPRARRHRAQGRRK